MFCCHTGRSGEDHKSVLVLYRSSHEFSFVERVDLRRGLVLGLINGPPITRLCSSIRVSTYGEKKKKTQLTELSEMAYIAYCRDTRGYESLVERSEGKGQREERKRFARLGEEGLVSIHWCRSDKEPQNRWLWNRQGGHRQAMTSIGRLGACNTRALP